MNAGRLTTYCDLTGVLMSVFLYRLKDTNNASLMQQSLGGRAGFDVNGSHILSQCLLASISLIGGQAGAELI